MPRLARELSALAVGKIGKPGLHFVGGVQGLALQITTGAGRSWLLRAMVGGRRREIGLGPFPEVTLAMARDKARQSREMIRQGIDPVERARAGKSALRAAAAAAVTFKQTAEAYILAHEPDWKNAKHAQQWRNTLAQHAYPVMGHLLVRDVEKEHVLQVLRPIWLTTNETATRLRGRIELVLSYAMQAGYRSEGLNPARWKGGLDNLLPKPSKVNKVEHHPALPVRDMGTFMRRLRAAHGMGARALEFTILVAARSGEVRGATWAEIDLDERVWTVPAERMKAGKEHRVPLSVSAVELLKGLPRRRAQLSGEDEQSDERANLVFSAPRGGKLSDMTLTAVLRRLKVEAVPHGFRSTFRDWASEHTAYPKEVCEMALAHAIGDKVEAAYRRGDLFEKRRLLMADWAKFLERVETSAQVVDLDWKRP